MSTFKVEGRCGTGWEIIGSATQRDEAERIVNERVGRSRVGWLYVESGADADRIRVWTRKDAAVRVTERST